jgi:TonB family protein
MSASPLLGWAQSDKARTYFDSKWHAVFDSTTAVYYRTVENAGAGFIVRDYYKSTDKLQMVAECSSVSPELVQEGKATFYHENGLIKSEGTYHKDKASGLHKTYYLTGKPQTVTRFDGDEETYIHYWSEEGAELIPNGSGTIKITNENLPDSYSIIKDSLLFAQYTILDGDSVFSVTEVMPEYIGGLESFYRTVPGIIKYPKSARKMGIEGTVYVGFVVTKTGDMDHFKVVKGIQQECDAEALNAVKQMKKWHPGSLNGKPVSVKYVMPIKFKLTI